MKPYLFLFKRPLLVKSIFGAQEICKAWGVNVWNGNQERRSMKKKLRLLSKHQQSLPTGTFVIISFLFLVLNTELSNELAVSEPRINRFQAHKLSESRTSQFQADKVDDFCPKSCECKWKKGKETVTCSGGQFKSIPMLHDSGTQVGHLQIYNLLDESFIMLVNCKYSIFAAF